MNYHNFVQCNMYMYVPMYKYVQCYSQKLISTNMQTKTQQS